MNELERYQIRRNILSAPRAAIEFDDKLVEWLIIAACAFSAFIVSNYAAINKLVQEFWCFWLVGFLAASAIFGLTSRFCAAAYLKLITISDAANSHMSDLNFQAYLDEANKIFDVLMPAWYAPIARLGRSRRERNPNFMDLKLFRLAFYQNIFSTAQRVFFSLFVIMGFSLAYVVMAHKV